MTGGTIESQVSRFLFKYRTTPHSTTGVSPAELMFNIRSFDGKNKWLPGTITNKQGPLTFRITLDDDRVVQRHIDHIRSRECIGLPVGTATFDDVVPIPIEDDITEQSVASTAVTAPLRRSTRISHPPSRLIEEINN